jgi:hypothetical protein
MMGYWIVTIEGLKYMNGVEEIAVGTLSIGRNPLDSLFNKDGDMNLDSFMSIFGYEEFIPIQECLSIALERMSRNADIKSDILNDKDSGWEVGVISIPEERFPKEWLGR